MDSDRQSERLQNQLNGDSNFRETDQNFMPRSVIENFNQQLGDIKQVVKTQNGQEEQQEIQQGIISDGQRQNLAQLFTDKPQSQPIIQKKLSNHQEDEVDEVSNKKSRNMSSQNVDSNSEIRSQNKSGNQRALMAKKTFRRMNSKIKARQSVMFIKPYSISYTTRITNIVESLPFSITMAIVTLYALFGDDIRILSVNKDGDDVFFALTIICMCFFTLEIIFTCISNPEYICNFYFWLDVISTVTMILDIGWITDKWYDNADVVNASSIKTISSASKVARKAARVIRVIRLVRLVKLYKHARKQLERQQQKKVLRDLLQKAQISADEKQKQQLQQQQDLEKGEVMQLQQEINLSQQQQQNQGEDQKQNLQQIIAPKQTQSKLQYPIQKILPSEEDQIKDVSQQDDQFKNQNNSKQLNQSSQSQNQSFQNQKQIIQKGYTSQSQSSDKDYSISRSPGKPGRSGGKTNSAGESSIMNDGESKESKVGVILSDLVMRRVIIIILAVLISIPLINYDTFYEKISSYDSGVFRIAQFREKYEYQAVKEMLIKQYAEFHIGQIYSIQSVYVLENSTWSVFNYQDYPDYFEHTDLLPSQYRFTDLQYYTSVSSGDILTCYSAADLVSYNQTNALLSIFQTIFVCIVLAMSALLFNKDVEDMVIEPIETMMKQIELIAANPLEAVNIEEQEDLVMEELEKSQDVKKLKEIELERTMETYILSRLIMKIGALLAVGFGEAGSEIIAENIKKGGTVDPMIPGKKIMAIFGFCDIRNFTDATEVLQKDVMVFVNEIAEIVHSVVNSFSGSANKNIGDAFLLVWKYEPQEYHPDTQNLGKLVLNDTPLIRQKGDMAVMAFLKVITSVSISKKLDKYKHHQGLNARMKDYSVKMGFGLHMGWGIEGAIGSGFKIDASYLSPNVNMASRLEAATKQFGSIFLISGILREYLSQSCQEQLRLIDIVTVKGSIEPVKLFTVDLSLKQLAKKIMGPIDKFDTSKMTQRECKKYRVVQKYQRDQLHKKVESSSIKIADYFKTDEELIAARSPFTKEFYKNWETGFELYIQGKWEQASSIFSKTLTMIPDHKDGPSNTLLEVLRQNGNKAPNYWKGYRELTEK